MAPNPPLLPADMTAQQPIQAKLGEQISVRGFDESARTIRPGDTPPWEPRQVIARRFTA